MPLSRKERGAIEYYSSDEFFLGIDPGLSGGLCLLQGGRVALDSNNEQSITGMPDTEGDIWDWIANNVPSNGVVFAVIERVGGYVKGNPAPGSRMFNFGANYGGLRMALIAAGISFEEIAPQKWQKALGITSRKPDESANEHKNRLKARAQQLFPKTPGITLKTCDALLIAEYCRRYRTGTL